MKKKLTALVLTFAMVVTTVITGTTVVKADTASVTPKYMKTMDDYNSTVGLSWEHTYVMPFEQNDQDVYEDVVVTIPKDSVVRVDVASTETYEGGSLNGMSWGDVDIYTNSIMSEKASNIRYYCGSDESASIEKKLIHLKKGTYYFRVIAHRNNYDSNATTIINTKLYLTAIATKDAFSVTTKSVSKSPYNLVFKNNIGSDLAGIYYKQGTWSYNDGTYGLQSLGTTATAQKVSKPGKYCVVFAFEDGKFAFDLNEYNSVIVNVNVKSTDKTKPTISGVSNGKTYNKAVTIKFSDKGSGIKSAKLNGKTIKSGKKVSKNGSYTLVVIDNAGNKNTVKFKIKIK